MPRRGRSSRRLPVHLRLHVRDRACRDHRDTEGADRSRHIDRALPRAGDVLHHPPAGAAEHDPVLREPVRVDDHKTPRWRSSWGDGTDPGRHPDQQPTMLYPTEDLLFIAVIYFVMCFAFTELSAGWSAGWPGANRSDATRGQRRAMQLLKRTLSPCTDPHQKEERKWQGESGCSFCAGDGRRTVRRGAGGRHAGGREEEGRGWWRA